MKKSVFVLFCVLSPTAIANAESSSWGLEARISNLSRGSQDVNYYNHIDSDQQIGFGIGGSYQWDCDDGHAFAPRVSLTSYKSIGTFERMEIGIDYKFYISEKVNTGFYLGGGVSYILAADSDKSIMNGLSMNDHDSFAAVSVNGGFVFDKHLGVEFRITHGSGERSSTDFSAACTYRF